MNSPNGTRVLRRADLDGQLIRSGPSTSELPRPIPPESHRDNWINLGLGALADAVLFGCMIAGTIFLAFAIYNALCDPFQYFNIVLAAAVVYLIFLVLISLWTYFFGNGQFSDTESQSNAQSNNVGSTRPNNSTNNARGDQPNNDPSVRRDLIVSRRESDAIAASNFVQESITVDRISEGLQRGRSVSRTEQSDVGQENQRRESSDRIGSDRRKSSDRNAQEAGRNLSRTGQSENIDQENLTADRNVQGFQRGRNLSRTGHSENSGRDREGVSTDRNAEGSEARRNLSRTGQAENVDRETADRNAQGYQTGRGLSGEPGESYRNQTDDVSNNRRTSGIEASTIYPPSQKRTRPTIPRVNEFQGESREDWHLGHDMGQNRQPENTGDDNTWFSSTQQRNARPYISTDFASCVAQTLRTNAPRCTVTTLAAGTSIVQYEPQVITIPLKIRRNADGTNQVIVSSSPTCRQPLTLAQQRTPSTTRTCPRQTTPPNCVRIGQSNCNSRSRASQHCPHTCPSGTGWNSNSQQGQDFNFEGDRQIFPQPGPCFMTPNRPAENAFFSPGTDGYD